MKKAQNSSKASKAKSKPAAKPAAKAAKASGKVNAKPLNSKATPKATPKAAAKAAVKPAAKTAKAAKPQAKPQAKPVKALGKPGAKVAAKPVAKAAKPTKVANGAVPAAPLKGAKVTAPVEKAAKVPKAPSAAKAAPGKAGSAALAKPVKVEPKISIPEEPDTAEDIVLTDADGRRFCRTKDCDRLAEVDNYCRYHYILLWKNIQIRRNILQEGKLGRYVEELTARYPDKFLEILKKDLRSEKDFLAAIQELEIDESAVEAEFDDEEAQSDLFEIQRVSDAGNAGDRSDSDDRF